MRADMAKQATMLAGVVLLVPGIDGAPLAQHEEKDKDEQTDPLRVDREVPSRHSAEFRCGRQPEDYLSRS